MPAQPLTLPEREEIRAGIERGEPLGRIAQRLGRHRCTISAEVNRNGGRDTYRATAAQTNAAARAKRPKDFRFAADTALGWHVTKRLLARDSPMTISIELARGTHGVTASVSHECIYRAVYAHGARGLPAGLHSGLHRRHRCRKRRLPPGDTPAKPGPLGVFNLIDTRPGIAGGRSQVGHLEGDLIIGAFNQSAIVTVFDRASRYCWLAGLRNGHGADVTLAALIELIARIPVSLRRTLTWDQGREMARHHQLSADAGIDVYFAEPHSPWQRPTNENGNGILRRYVGKGTDLNIYTDDDLRRIEARVNTIPRRSLDWTTAHDRYHAAVAMTD